LAALVLIAEEHAVVLARHLGVGVSEPVEDALVDPDDAAVHIELDHHLGAVDGFDLVAAVGGFDDGALKAGKKVEEAGDLSGDDWGGAGEEERGGDRDRGAEDFHGGRERVKRPPDGNHLHQVGEAAGHDKGGEGEEYPEIGLEVGDSAQLAEDGEDAGEEESVGGRDERVRGDVGPDQAGLGEVTEAMRKVVHRE